MTLEEIYESHADFVWRTLRHLTPSESDAKDAMQEVFLTVHRTLVAFEGRSSLRTWLYTICRSVARAQRRRAHVRREVVDDEVVATQLDGRSDASTQVEVRQQLAQLNSLLAQLPGDQREVFVLFEIESLTGEEIAQALEVPVATVHSRLRLAREAFRHALERLEARLRFEKMRAGGAP